LAVEPPHPRETSTIAQWHKVLSFMVVRLLVYLDAARSVRPNDPHLNNARLAAGCIAIRATQNTVTAMAMKPHARTTVRRILDPRGASSIEGGTTSVLPCIWMFPLRAKLPDRQRRERARTAQE
jgi:hypothetical protein